MAVEVESLLLAVGIMVASAYLALLVFRRFRLPDVLFLILLGVVLGPVTRLVDVELFRAIGPLVGVVAIIIILFDGGLEIHFAHLRSGALTGLVLAAVVFVLTACVCALVVHLVGGYGVVNSALLGMAFGGAGVVIVIPLIQHMGVRPESVTVVSIEAAIADVFVIVGIYGLATAVAFERTGAAEMLSGVVATFSVALILGLAAGYLWARALGQGLLADYRYVLTLAALFLLYVGVEALRGSGPIAVLAFGLVVGNSRKTEAFVAESRLGRPRRRKEDVPVFGEELAGFHHEIVFLVRAFFFVGLGVTMDIEVFRSLRFVVLGVLLTAVVALARWAGVRAVVPKDRFPAWDRLAISLMFPLGLAAAALSQVPHQRFGIAGTEDFASLAAVVVVLTNALATLLVWFWSQPWAGRRGREPDGPSDLDAVP